MSDTDVATARRALALLDLTELGDDASDDDVRRLCARAHSAHGDVAAVCVWPRSVATAVSALAGTAIRIATVTNFPSGAEPLEDVVEQTKLALGDGADEIDVVLPYQQLMAGRSGATAALIDAVRHEVPRTDRHRLKVILETGELNDVTLIGMASRLAIEHGADFIKTSTGKSPISATLPATAVMLHTIKDLDTDVGLKPSGGIRSLADASAYLDQADDIMGPTWVGPTTFRFGASGLFTALVAVIDEQDDPARASGSADSSKGDY